MKRCEQCDEMVKLARELSILRDFEIRYMAISIIAFILAVMIHHSYSIVDGNISTIVVIMMLLSLIVYYMLKIFIVSIDINIKSYHYRRLLSHYSSCNIYRMKMMGEYHE